MQHPHEDPMLFRTHWLLPDMFDKNSTAFYNLLPGSDSWNMTQLLCFLNEFPEFKPSKHHSSKRIEQQIDYTLHFTFIDSHDDSLQISISHEITVKIAKNALMRYFYPFRKTFRSNLIARNRTGTTERKQVHISYHKMVPSPSDGTNAIMNHMPLLFTMQSDYSRIFHYFAKQINTETLIRNDISAIKEYVQTFIKTKSTTINSLAALQSLLHGYLEFDIQKSNRPKKLAVITLKDTRFFIVSGIYISPYAKSLFLENGDNVSGILLDTTFKLLPYYVVSILMISYKNVGIPISFAFGASETKELYNKHFNALNKLLHIDISKFVMESDQGSALAAFCREHSMVHLACLRHLLVSLKRSEFSYIAWHLLKAETPFELNNVMQKFSGQFSQRPKTDIEKLNVVLEKIGLAFKNETIVIANHSRWQEVSMHERVAFRMPSTTNSLESTHGQLNEKTPRHNTFWHALYRVASNLIFKTQNVEERMQHNYNYIKSRIVNKRANIHVAALASECNHYCASITQCSCSETKLASALLGIDIPCSHRVNLGVPFPPCPKANINLRESINELSITYNVLRDDIVARAEIRNGEHEINYIVDAIVRYSGNRDVSAIKMFVEKQYDPVLDAFYINGKRWDVVQLIQEGICKFQK
jgi:hypothetical protein